MLKNPNYSSMFYSYLKRTSYVTLYKITEATPHVKKAFAKIRYNFKVTDDSAIFSIVFRNL